MMIKLPLLLCFMGILVLGVPDAYGLKLSPMKQNFSYSGKNNLKTFKLQNNENYKMKFQLKVYERSFSKDNQELRFLSTDFKLNKSIIELLPGKSSKVDLRFIGTKVAIEKSYIFAISEIGSDNNEELRYLSQIEASLYIGERNQRASLSLINAVQIKNNLELSFENIGTKHIKLKRYKVVLIQGETKYDISFRSKEYSKLGEQIILPGVPRKIIIQGLSKFNPGKVAGKFHRLFLK